jgi:hypothetical protein
VTDLDHQHEQHLVADFVDDPAVADADAPCGSAGQFWLPGGRGLRDKSSIDSYTRRRESSGKWRSALRAGLSIWTR